MKKPYLVLTAGYPCAGKSQAAGFLRDELGFIKLSSDNLREDLYGVKDFDKYKKEPGFKEKESLLFSLIGDGKLRSLYNGFDVVIDSTATYDDSRAFLFNTMTRQGELLVDRSLLHIKARDDIIRARNRAKGRDNDVVEEWGREWEEPTGETHGITYNVIPYDNNEPDDLEAMLKDLDKRFRRTKSHIYVPADLAGD